MNITPDTSSQEDINNLPINILNQPNIFKIASSIVSSLCETVKQNQIMTFIETHKINIMELSETKLSSRAAEFINKNSNSYISWWNCDDKNKDGTGVSIVINKHTSKFVQKVSGEKDYKGRLLYVDLYMKGHSKLRVIQTYIHANNIEKQQTLILYEKILKIIDQAQQNDFKIIIMGDFNINLIKFEQITRRDGTIPWKFSFISKLYNRNFLNTFSQFHDQLKPTWHSGQRSGCLDHIWIFSSLQSELLYADIEIPEIYRTDHLVPISFFLCSDIFERLSHAKYKQREANIIRYNYDKMNNLQW